MSDQKDNNSIGVTHRYSSDENRGISRRAFLQATMLSAGTTVLTRVPLAMAQDQPATRTPQADDKATSQVAGFDPEQIEDTWGEPWIWGPSRWPGQQLQLNAVENTTPIAGIGTGFENIRPVLFSYTGISPGPTVRMQGDETLYLKLRNLLGLNAGSTITGPYPDPNSLPPGVSQEQVPTPKSKLDWCLGEHTNGVHSVRTTNLHTHGLHVRPGRNPDGTSSDDVLLRVIPQEDFLEREDSPDPDCRFLKDNEVVGEADYEFRLGNVENSGMPHPPGTHWYHPHSHGATHNQVASGMAGFLIIEGDVDQYLNEQLAERSNPNPQVATGPYGYRERLIFMQRVNPSNTAQDPDNPNGVLRAATFLTVNGSFEPKVMVMQPGAIERWRVLNGSVDGRGYVRFMVLKGQFELCENGQIGEVDSAGVCIPLSTTEIEARKQQIYQLSMDGVTLVRQTGEAQYQHYIKDLQFTAPLNPFDLRPDDTVSARIATFDRTYENADSIRAAYIRPNEVMLAPANRSDILFRAPTFEAGETSTVYTLIAQMDVLHNDNYEKGLRNLANKGDESLPDWPGDTLVAYLVVKGDPVERADRNPIPDLALPPVPDYLRPIQADELRIGDAEAVARGDVSSGMLRTRTIVYSGWGNADFPIIPVNPSNIDVGFLNVFYGPIAENRPRELVLLPPNLRTMAIDGRKFDPSDPVHPKIWENSAEEWVLYNNSVTLWSDGFDTDWKGHAVGYPFTRAEAQTQDLRLITTTTVDHPFHIHINPFWLSRLEVPDRQGNLVNILSEPRWQDVAWIPRGTGRVAFRARFPDFTGIWVNHCHILLHEDNGMMQIVEGVANARNSNYVGRNRVADSAMSANEVSDIYPRSSLNQAYSQSARFLDPNTNEPQDFPGFEVRPPTR